MKCDRRILMVMMFAIAVFVVGAIPAAHSTPVLDFGVIAPTAGSISFGGGVAPLVGTNIEVDNVVGLSTPLNNGIARILFNAVLNFQTGPHSGAWNFGGGGANFITIVGGVDLNGSGVEDAGDIPSGTTLLTGNFGHANVTHTSGTFHIAGGAFADTKDEDLLNFYGLPHKDYKGNFNISFNAPFAGIGNAFASTNVLSGDIVNEPVPEPSTLLLLCGGLISLGLFFRRKPKKQV